MKKKLVMTPSQAQSYFQVTNQTLIRWSKQNRIETWRSPGNVRRYIWYENIDSPEEPSKEEQQADIEQRKTEIEARLAELESKVDEDESSLFARHAASFEIPRLERELKELS